MLQEHSPHTPSFSVFVFCRRFSYSVVGFRFLLSVFVFCCRFSFYVIIFVSAFFVCYRILFSVDWIFFLRSLETWNSWWFTRFRGQNKCPIDPTISLMMYIHMNGEWVKITGSYCDPSEASYFWARFVFLNSLTLRQFSPLQINLQAKWVSQLIIYRLFLAGYFFTRFITSCN